MLTQQLRELERDGLIERTQYEEKVIRVIYGSTTLAMSLAPVFSALKAWTGENGKYVIDARKKFD